MGICDGHDAGACLVEDGRVLKDRPVFPSDIAGEYDAARFAVEVGLYTYYRSTENMTCVVESSLDTIGDVDGCFVINRNKLRETY